MILDHIDDLGLQDDEAEQHRNELRTLDYLSVGLGFLNAQVQQIESGITSKLPKDRLIYSFGNDPRLEGVPQELVACAFHWYSVTACNYVRLVGWLVNDGDSQKALEYLKQVLPPVYKWRNKIGAHFARVDPRNDDTLADLAKSVTFPIGFMDDAFYTDPITLTLASGEAKPKPPGISDLRWRLLAASGRKVSVSSQDTRWSLTHTHRELSLRYWPAQAS